VDLTVAQRRLIIFAASMAALVAYPGAAAAPAKTTVFNDIVINERLDGDVVAFEADVHLGPLAEVEGDVVVVGGDLYIDSGARVGRHVLAVFGTVVAAPEAKVEGRTLAFSSLSSVVLTPGSENPLTTNLAVRLLTSGGWLLVTTALAFGFSARLRYGVWVLPLLGARTLVLGVAVGITFFAAVVAVLGLGPSLGVPLAAAITVGFFALRALGLTVIGGLIGGAVLRRWVRHPLPLTLEVFVGMLAVLALRFLPLMGGVIWSAFSLASLGTGIIVLVTVSPERRIVAGETG
jgi:hypothetical protein